MRKRIRVLPYRSGSKSAKALAQALGGLQLKLEGSKFKAYPSDTIVNWGNRRGSDYAGQFTRHLTSPNEVRFYNWKSDVLEEASNKLKFFKMMASKDYIPSFWTSKEDIPEDAYPIVCRTLLNSHSGKGIVLAESLEELVDAPLYVQYIKKKEEYRVHVGTRWSDSGERRPCVISIQQKKRKKDHEDPNWQIRNHSNGFIYARSDVDPPRELIDAALDCLGASGLDFGAVDVIWNEKQEKAYVLEINTAPGLEGTTVKDYVKYFTENR